jgi:hypothetical protein
MNPFTTDVTTLNAVDIDKMNKFTTGVKTLNINGKTGPLNQLGDKRDVVESMTQMPEGFVPGDNDVICGRGRECFNHNGNERFRRIVYGYLDQYSKSISKMEKSYILSDIVAKIRKSSPNGGAFVKKCPESKQYYDVGCFLAREKTSQAFRDALHDKYKSSNSAKKKRRQASQAEKLQKAYSASNLAYNATAEPLDAYAQSSSNFMRVARPGDLLQKAYSASNLGCDAAAEDPLLGSLGIRRGVSSQNLASRGSSRSVLDFNRVLELSTSGREAKTGAWFNRSCPNLGVPTQIERASVSTTFSEEYQSSSRIAENQFLDSKPYFSHSSTSLMSAEESIAGAWFNRSCPNLSIENKSYQEFGVPTQNFNRAPVSKTFSEENQSSLRIAQNRFLDSKPYFSHSSKSLMSVEESIAENQEAFAGYEEPMRFPGKRELPMESLSFEAPNSSDGGDLLASLPKLMDGVGTAGDPFEPVPFPELKLKHDVDMAGILSSLAQRRRAVGHIQPRK